MLIKDLMVKKENLISIEAMAPLRDALVLMRKHGIKSLVVEKSNPNDAYGILTFKKIINAVIASDGDIDLLRVYDLCIKPTVHLPGELDIKYAAQMMMNNNIKRILIADGNELQGMVTMTDMLEALFRTLDEEI